MRGSATHPHPLLLRPRRLHRPRRKGATVEPRTVLTAERVFSTAPNAILIAEPHFPGCHHRVEFQLKRRRSSGDGKRGCSARAETWCCTEFGWSSGTICYCMFSFHSMHDLPQPSPSRKAQKMPTAEADILYMKKVR